MNTLEELKLLQQEYSAAQQKVLDDLEDLRLAGETSTYNYLFLQMQWIAIIHQATANTWMIIDLLDHSDIAFLRH